MLPLDDIIRQIMNKTGKSAAEAAKIARVAELQAMKAAKKPTTRIAGGMKIEKAPVKPKTTPKATVKPKSEPKPYSPGPRQSRSMMNKQMAHEKYVAQLDRHIANAEHPTTKAAAQKAKADYLKKYKAQQGVKVRNIQQHRTRAEKRVSSRAARKK